jgi:hypothetical protein
MILNDEPNCQVSRILMNPRPIWSDSSETLDMNYEMNIMSNHHNIFYESVLRW